jgi:hypothetical protein
MNEKDIEYLKEKDEERYKAFLEGKYIPRISIDLSLLKYKILKKPSRHIIISLPPGERSSDTFSAVFRMPQFGDVLTISSFMKSEFGEGDKEYNEYLKKLMKAKSEDENYTPSEEDQIRFTEYLAIKMETAAAVNMAILLEEVDGKPVKDLEEALKIVEEDPRFDLSLSQALKEAADKVGEQIGIEEEIKLINPITEKPEIRRFQFRLYDIFQALVVSKPNRYTISVDT